MVIKIFPSRQICLHASASIRGALAAGENADCYCPRRYNKRKNTESERTESVYTYIFAASHEINDIRFIAITAPRSLISYRFRSTLAESFCNTIARTWSLYIVFFIFNSNVSRRTSVRTCNVHTLSRSRPRNRKNLVTDAVSAYRCLYSPAL